MEKMTLHELYLKAAEKAKEAHLHTKLVEYVEYSSLKPYVTVYDYPCIGFGEFCKIIEDYLKDTVGKGNEVEIYGSVSEKTEKYLEIKILYLIDKGGTLLPWEGSLFFDRDISRVRNMIGKKGISIKQSDKLNLRDYVICTLSANSSIYEILDGKRPFSFKWGSIKKVNSANDNKYICNIVRLLKKSDNDSQIVIPLDEKLAQILEERIKEKSDELDELERKIDGLEIQKMCVNELDKYIMQRKNTLQEKEKDIENKNLEIAYKNKELLDTKKEIKNVSAEFLTKKKELSDVKEEIEKISNSEEYKAVKFAQKFIVTEKEKELLLPQVDFADFNTKSKHFIDELSAYMQGYMYNDGFLYSKEILKNTFYALQTNQLIIYAGKPGSGKSQLVKHLADLFGAGYADVAVQSSWMDKSDLLGFYDPIHNNYIGTAFLDKLREMCKEARNNPERLFIMCLDEMNLAHVEYYFADFLSRLQASDDERSIDLYSKTTENELKEEVILRTSRCIENINDADFYKKDFLKNFVSSNVDEFVRVKKMWNMLVEYPRKIDIPKNVKFFGTINTDATTKDLSPKVLDRAFVFKLEREDIDVPKKGNYDKNVDFYSITNKTKNVDKCEKNAQNAVAIFNDLTNNDLNIGISMRVQKQLAQISYATESDLADILFACIILPKISGISMEKANEKLQYRCEPYKYAKTVYGFIKTNCIGSSYYSFWR